MKLTLESIKRPAGTIILMIVIAVLGIAGFTSLPVNMLPDITYPMVKVYVYWPGATPEQMENEVAMVIERKMATVDNLDYIESTSEEGVYTLLVNFDYSVDRDVAYQDVLAKMGLVKKELPQEILEPVVFKADPSQLPVVELLVSSDNMSLTQLRTWIENEFQEQFASVKGSAGTALSGGTMREIRIHVDPVKLQGYNITLSQITERLKNENIDMVGGRMLTPTRDYIVRTYGEFKSISEIEDLVIRKSSTDAQILLKDVAVVEDLYALQKIRTKYNGHEGVRISIFKQAEANAVEVSDEIARRVKELKEELPETTRLEIIYDQAEYVRLATNGVRDAVLLAAIFVVLITALFLSGWRRVLVLILSLPVTILGTFFLMWLLGYSVNIFTLGGLVVAMTVVLDNSVVILENITRIQETEPESSDQVTLGSLQVTGAIITSTVTFLSLFIPFLLVPGLSSLLFRELVLTVAIIIFFSMVVSLTVTPMLMALFYPASKRIIPKHGIISRGADYFIKGIIFIYKPILKYSLKFRWIVLLAFLLLLIPGYSFLKRTGSEFLPKADDGLININIVMPTGTSMEETDRALSQAEEVIKKQEFIKGYATLAGGKVWGLVTTESSFLGELNVELVPASQRPMNTDEYVEMLRPQIMKAVKVPGAVVKVMHAKMKGIRQIGQFDIEVMISAPRSVSMQEIYNVASSVRNEVREYEFLTGLDISLQLTKPEYQIHVDRQKAFDLGLSYSDIGNTVRTMVGGTVPTRYKEGAYYYPVRVVMDEREIQSSEALENLYVYSAKGVKIPLSAVAEVVKTTGPVQIDRQNQDRLIKVTANVAGISVGEATNIIKQKLDNFNLPSGYRINYGGQSQMLSENMRQIAIILLFALFLGYAVLVLYFESFIKPLIIIIRIPLSLAGISYALYITGTPISVTALIGIILLTGMEINNGVLLLTFIDELREKGMDIKEAIKQAALIRLRPILITNLNSLAGLLPLALTMGDGTEMLKPMAIVVIGGVLFGLLLVFIFLPVTYMIIYGKRPKMIKTL
ncbi:MAG TPA: efflux RND transporter permease subunit [Bacteroidales bacterium]|nr:efflux RND transporter permease subunit [Bacteroidales bacterium]HOK74921.1 efflux RND transporter permease subunit [Bacteroidales bacterium]HOM39505.1 efflux RND transporter permease subunit [Bacteroidales bacterium]HOU30763.1 efflux RND transporter permease subunit [Bacteroidales bacterium]HPP91887.1 efflux RND transporter permease subunit [Bacteroidales bacterium]